MNDPITTLGTSEVLPPGSVFTPQPPASPPVADVAPPAAAEPPTESARSTEAWHAVLSRHYGVQGRLEVLERRLGELLAGHAAVVSHITGQAPAASASTPGGTAFWGQILDQHQIIHGVLKAAETEAAGLLVAHAGAIGALESLL
jgi:hypothetical protein